MDIALNLINDFNIIDIKVYTYSVNSFFIQFAILINYKLIKVMKNIMQ